MTERLTATVGDIVAGDFRAAGVFERHGIDFCCGGRRSLDEACEMANVDPAAIVRELEALSASERPMDDAGGASDWPLPRLIDHIESVHHTYVRAALPRIAGYLAKLVEVHGVRHPELEQVAAHFDRLRVELSQHMRKEEQVLFPFVRELVEHAAEGRGVLMSPFGTVANPIRMMEREHREAGDDLMRIRQLTHGYAAQEEGCATYRVCMTELAEFERDLHRHVHLENNVLFPRAVALEQPQPQVR